jgi:hypothetical protein
MGTGAAAGAACGPFGVGVCDHATVVAHNETAPAKISPVTMRISLNPNIGRALNHPRFLVILA